MTDPIEPEQPRPQPEPVLNAATIGGAASGLVSAAGMFLVFYGFTTPDRVHEFSAITTGVITAAVALLAALAPYVTAVRARNKVTPITRKARPRDAQGQLLVPIAEYGRHAKKTPPPPAPPSTVQRSLEHLRDRYGPDPDDDRDVEEFVQQIRTSKEQPRVIDPHGIHAHPTRKLGKRPPIPGRKAVPFGEFLTAAPDHPLIDAAPQLVFPMDHNDRAGCCVVAALDHALQAICALLGVDRPNWTDDQLLAFYRTQNPDFRSWADGGGSADRGMVIQTFLEYLVAQGVILAFGKIDHANEDELKAAVYLGLAVVTGEELDVAQQTQSVWDYKPSQDWGGHATCTVGYQASPDRQTVVTWGELVDVTQAFIAHQLDEAWFVLTQAHVDHPGFREHFDLAGFAAAVSELTGGKVVVPIPAPQPPAPEPPAPAPGPAPAPLPADVTAWARRVAGETWAAKRDQKAARELLDWSGQ